MTNQEIEKDEPELCRIATLASQSMGATVEKNYAFLLTVIAKRTGALLSARSENEKLQIIIDSFQRTIADGMSKARREDNQTAADRITTLERENAELKSRVAELEKAVGETSLAFDEYRGVWVRVYCA